MHLLKGIVVESVGRTALCRKFQCLWSLLAGNHNKSQLKPRPPADGNPALCFLPTPTKPSDKLLRYFMKNASAVRHRQVYLINLANKPFKPVSIRALLQLCSAKREWIEGLLHSSKVWVICEPDNEKPVLSVFRQTQKPESLRHPAAKKAAWIIHMRLFCCNLMLHQRPGSFQNPVWLSDNSSHIVALPRSFFFIFLKFSSAAWAWIGFCIFPACLAAIYTFYAKARQRSKPELELYM